MVIYSINSKKSQNIKMLRSKDAIRIVTYFVLPQFYPTFAYREADAPFYAHIGRVIKP